jgi:beta-ureidopropionase
MVKVALVQMKCVTKKEENIKKALNYVADAKRSGAEIVCLPEQFSNIYIGAFQDPKYFSLAESIPGPTTQKVCEAAAENNVTIIGSIFEEDRKLRGRYFNTSIVVGPDGELLGIYRKSHIPNVGGFLEKFYFTPGDTAFPVFQTPKAKIGVIMCYDRHFPEGVRIEALKGAEIVFIPTCTSLLPEAWEVELRAHAIFNEIFVAGVNRVGVESQQQPNPYYGRSLAVNPKGEVIASAGIGEELLIVDMILSEIVERRRASPHIVRDRRPELYGYLTEFQTTLNTD